VLEPEPFVEVNLADAAGAGIRDGDVVQLASRRGTIEVRARAVEALPPGLVRLTPHFHEAPFNRLVGEEVEPSTGTPLLKFTPVRVQPARAIGQAAD
jgi:predicted molibdopterin-dependent oxidoreductase YjgC